MIIYFSDSVRRASMLESRSAGHAAEETYGGERGALPDPDYAPEFHMVRAAIRQTRDSTCTTTVDRDLAFYVDAGGWGLHSDGTSSTNFVLISGPDVLLCNWMNLARDGARPNQTTNAAGQACTVACGAPSGVGQWWSSLASGARQFLQGAQARPGGARGFVLGAMRGPADFVGPDRAIVVLPDLHIRLRTGKALDLFLYDQGGQLVSLGGELRAFLDYAHNDRNAETVQVGDMYETWETEILVRLRFRELLEYVEENADFWREHGVTVRSDWRHMISSRQVIRDVLFIDPPWSWNNWGISHRTALSDAEVDRESVLFTSTEDIEADIRDQHSSLFGGSSTLTRHDLRGNHDNNMTNYYWRDEAEDSYRRHAELQELTSSSRNDTRPFDCRLGNNDCIWFEHGHKYDWHNCNTTWWHPGRGFHCVVLMTENLRDHAWTVGEVRSAADVFTDVSDAEMRHFTLLRVDEILRDEQAVKLVVMGHTHEPCMLRGSRTDSFFWMHPHAEHYLTSGCCLRAAASLASSLPGARTR